MPDKLILSASPLTRQKYTPTFKAEGVRQVAAGARQTVVARAQGLSPALLGRWQRPALAEAAPGSAEPDALKRVEMERDMFCGSAAGRSEVFCRA